MTDRTPTGDLRDQIAEALYQWTLNAAGASSTSPPLHPRILENLRVNSLARADAVMPLVQAAIADRDREIEQLRDMYVSACDRARSVRDDLKWARSELAKADAENRATGQRAEKAETRLQQALDQIATERRGRLAAEAAVRRALAVLDQTIPADHIGDVGPQLREALTIKQPKETP